MERKEDNIWGVISSLQKIKVYYENDLGKDNDDLNAYIRGIERLIQHNKKVDLSQSIEKTEDFWKGLITESIEELLKTIESKRGHGGEFAKDKIELGKLKEDITFAEIDLETFEATYEDLKEKREIVKEKVVNLNIKKKELGYMMGINS